MSGQQKEEVETILMEIYKKYGLSKSLLYYKTKHEALLSVQLGLESSKNYSIQVIRSEGTEGYEESSEDYNRFLNIVFDPNLEYALYIGFKYDVSPSSDCIRFRRYFYSITSQFIGPSQLSDYIEFASFIARAMGIRGNDPSSQLFAYIRLLRTQQLQHVYFCPNVYHIEPYDPDPASIFSGKEGVVAYCMPLYDFILTELRGGLYNVFKRLRDIDNKASNKLLYNKDLGNTWEEKDRVMICDINLLKSIIHDEIEEVNEFMKQYGIIRVAFPLDKLGS